MNRRNTPIVVGNWKTTPATLKEAVSFIKRLDKKCGEKKSKNFYFLAVPDIFIPHLNKLSKCGKFGSQNVSGIEMGQKTGLTIPSMLLTGGACFTLIGHSEVRERGEDEKDRAKKVALSLQAKLLTILCVGEKVRDGQGKYLGNLEEDIRESLSLVSKNLFENLIIAYEPVWAIGGKEGATEGECFEVIIAIRRALASLIGIEYAKKVKILYGGTVNKENAKKFIEEGGADGLLIGRASQDTGTFGDIIMNCND